MRSRLRIFALAIAALALSAQDQEINFRSTSNLVVVDVFVRDKSGKEIDDLKKDDFTVFEDGKPQKVAVFEFQKLSSTPAPQQAAPEEPAPKAPPARQSLSIATAHSMLKYQNHRLIVLFFDLSSMQPPEQERARKAALDFIDTKLAEPDLVAVMTYANEVQILQDFTADREKLRAVIRSLALGNNSDRAVPADTGDDTSGADTQAAFVADETEFNIFNTDEKLAAL